MTALRIIWAGLIGGVVLYTVLVVSVTLTGISSLRLVDPALLNYAGAVVLLYMVGGVFLRRRLVADISDGSPEERLSAYSTATIIGAALTESGGLILVSLALMAGSPTWAAAGGLAAVVLMAMARPDPAEIGLD